MIFNVIPTGNIRCATKNIVPSSGISAVALANGSSNRLATGGRYLKRAKAMNTERGMLTAVTNVLRQERWYFPLTNPLRKIKMTTTAKTAPNPPSRATPLMDSSIKDDCSKATSNRKPGVAASSSSSLSKTAWETETVLASLVLAMVIPKLGLPSTRLMVSVGIKTSAGPEGFPSSSARTPGSNLARKSSGNASCASGGMARSISGVRSSSIAGAKLAISPTISAVRSSVVAMVTPCIAAALIHESGNATGSSADPSTSAGSGWGDCWSGSSCPPLNCTLATSGTNSRAGTTSASTSSLSSISDRPGEDTLTKAIGRSDRLKASSSGVSIPSGYLSASTACLRFACNSC